VTFGTVLLEKENKFSGKSVWKGVEETHNELEITENFFDCPCLVS
jgi:hypothetical protein